MLAVAGNLRDRLEVHQSLREDIFNSVLNLIKSSSVLRKNSLLKIVIISHASENWSGLVNICVFHAHQTRGIYQILPYCNDRKVKNNLYVGPTAVYGETHISK